MAEDPHDFADFARSLAAAARLETLPRCRERWDRAENKLAGGFDPVTASDRNSETAIRRLIEARFPDHGIAGEEFPDRPAAGRWSWWLDPIDGTRAYICGLPSWTTLIALLDEGEPVLGIVDVPRLDELYLGHRRGAGVRRAGERRPLATSGCRRLEEARLSTTDPYLFAGAEAEGFERLAARGPAHPLRARRLWLCAGRRREPRPRRGIGPQAARLQRAGAAGPGGGRGGVELERRQPTSARARSSPRRARPCSRRRAGC